MTRQRILSPGDVGHNDSAGEDLRGVVDGVSARGAARRGPSDKSGLPDRYKINAITGCWIWQRSADDDGYGYFRADGKSIRAHIHYYRAAGHPIPAGMELDHKCQNRLCVNPDHLEPVTHLENCRRGRVVKCMTIERAREVRARRERGETYETISRTMGITKSLVGQIATYRCWKESPAHPVQEAK